jgi:hypothetical protein
MNFSRWKPFTVEREKETLRLEIQYLSSPQVS